MFHFVSTDRLTCSSGFSCDKGHLGQRCECEKQGDEDTMAAMDEQCRRANESQLCSGQGSCECGACVCQGTHRGEYCECDDASCPRDNGLLCGGEA